MNHKYKSIHIKHVVKAFAEWQTQFASTSERNKAILSDEQLKLLFQADATPKELSKATGISVYKIHKLLLAGRKFEKEIAATQEAAKEKQRERSRRELEEKRRNEQHENEQKSVDCTNCTDGPTELTTAQPIATDLTSYMLDAHHRQSRRVIDENSMQRVKEILGKNFDENN